MEVAGVGLSSLWDDSGIVVVRTTISWGTEGPSKFDKPSTGRRPSSSGEAKQVAD